MAIRDITVGLHLDGRKAVKKLRVIRAAIDYILTEFEAMDNGCPVCGCEEVAYYADAISSGNVCNECLTKLHLDENGSWQEDE